MAYFQRRLSCSVLLLAVFGCSAAAQSTVNLGPLTVSADATTAINAYLVQQTNAVFTALTAPVGVGDTTINVVSSVGIPVNDAIQLGAEAMMVTASTSKTLTVTRGILGTVATTHPTSDIVRHLQFRSVAQFFRQTLLSTVAQILVANPPSSIATQNAAIAAAQAAIAATQAAAIQ